MMKRAHCDQCKRPAGSCYCHLLQQHDNDCPVIILQDAREAKHPLGTARIAKLGLRKCDLFVLENCDRSDPVAQAIIDRILSCNPILVYPGGDNMKSAYSQTKKPQPLLFIDATWRRSRKMLFEFPQLASLPRFALCDTPASRYRIRSAREEGALATLEAIVYSLQAIEHHAKDYLQLLAIMDWMISDQVSRMGESVFARNYRH